MPTRRPAPLAPHPTADAHPAPAPHRISACNLAALPSAPGVYVFVGEGGDSALPLYIGKSINIRSRVLSHLREPSEARMMRQVLRVDWVRTAGEIGALLLESLWIKTRHPLYNQRLRRSRELCAWQLPADEAAAPRLAFSRDVDFASTPGLYGLYTSAHAAQQALRELAQTHRLCQQSLGLEAPSARGCFGRQIGRCDGVCVGQEPASAHRARLLAVLLADQVQQWPYPGAVAIVERDGDWCQRHIVHHWRHLRTVDSHGRWPADGLSAPPWPPAPQGPPPPGAPAPPDPRRRGRASPARAASGFDLDAYRILMRPLMSGQGEVEAAGPEG